MTQLTTLAPAIEVRDVSASYHLRLDPDMSARGLLRSARRGEKRERKREIVALQGVSFDVGRGSVLGVIGDNGAGKSTLLRVVAGILSPSTGQIVVRGQISALLSIGVGMNEALTGRENIKLGGLAIGIDVSRLDDITEDIAEFSQLEEYLEFPVRAYSSGMRARLAFSIAAHLDPEILLVDEALAGGDAKFKEKVSGKMFDMCSNGRTIVLVSHGLSMVRNMATECLWLHEGKTVEFGDPDAVVDSYARHCRVAVDDLDWGD